MATPNRFQGCTAMLLVVVLIILGLIATVIGTVLNSAALGVFILIGFTVASVIVPVIIWIIEKAFRDVDQWFDRCDDKLCDIWNHLVGTRSTLQLQASQTTLRLTISILLLLSVIVIFIFLPVLPQSIHALFTRPPVAVPPCGICVDPKTHAGISDGQYRRKINQGTILSEVLSELDPLTSFPSLSVALPVSSIAKPVSIGTLDSAKSLSEGISSPSPLTPPPPPPIIPPVKPGIGRTAGPISTQSQPDPS